MAAIPANIALPVNKLRRSILGIALSPLMELQERRKLANAMESCSRYQKDQTKRVHDYADSPGLDRDVMRTGSKRKRPRR
jgi:hypothetical protein